MVKKMSEKEKQIFMDETKKLSKDFDIKESVAVLLDANRDYFELIACIKKFIKDNLIEEFFRDNDIMEPDAEEPIDNNAIKRLLLFGCFRDFSNHDDYYWVIEILLLAVDDIAYENDYDIPETDEFVEYIYSLSKNKVQKICSEIYEALE